MTEKRTKYAFVTGASSGIGYAVSIELARRGYKVFAGARRVAKMEPLKQFGITPIAIDVSSLESVQAARDEIAFQTDGYLDLLYNNAGIPCFAPAIEVLEEDVMNVLNVNVAGVIRVSREFRHLVIKAKGTIAFTGSVTAMFIMPLISFYGATKAAVDLYASGLEVELKGFGVTVVNVVTGGVNTEIDTNARGLAEDSMYNIPEVRKNIADKNALTEKNSTPVDEYAKRVVDQILHRPKLRFWRIYEGYSASQMHWVVSLIPDFIGRYIPEYVLGWTKVTAAIKKREAKAGA